eukprot:4743387-Prymnesium_polylepis.2
MNGEMQREKRDTDEQCHHHPGNFRLLFDQQNPSGKSQLAAHLERLPPENGCRIVARQEACGAGELCRGALEQRVAARPEQESVQNGRSDRPDRNEPRSHCASRIVLTPVATECRVRFEVAPHLALAVLEWLTRVCPEDAH